MSTRPGLFGDSFAPWRRVVVTGQVGVDKKPFLELVVDIAARHGRDVALLNVGDMMYVEAPDVVHGRILDLPLGRLNTLRRAAFKDILAAAAKPRHMLINTHATFRWKHGLFPAFDFDQMAAVDADLYVTLVDNLDAIHERLERDHDIVHSLKDILVWREEEILATELLANALAGYGRYFVLARGDESETAEALYRLMFEPHRKKVYPSFPMTHVAEVDDVLAEIAAFRAALSESFIAFDPGDVDEKELLTAAGAAERRGEPQIAWKVNDRSVNFRVADITAVAADIDGQIYARDFKLIDQSDMIVSFMPAMPDGRPALSSGVERELQHAHEATKEVYVVWRPAVQPSPFVTETATRVFRDLGELMKFFQQRGYCGDYQPRLPPRAAGESTTPGASA